MDEADWEQRVALLWASTDHLSDEDLLARMAKLVAERPEGDPVGLFEHGSAYDSTGHPELAVDRYRAALRAGLTGYRRRRATIQLASSLRNLGEVEESVALLTAELEAGSDDLDGPDRRGQEHRLAEAQGMRGPRVADLGRAGQAEQDRESLGGAHPRRAVQPQPLQGEVELPLLPGGERLQGASAMPISLR